MFLFFGTSFKEDTIREFTNVVCPVCGAMTMATLVYSYSYFHLFFIPLFRFSKRYTVRLRCCGAVFEATREQFEQMKNGVAPEFSSMTRADRGGGNGRRCPGCGADVDPRYVYCPFCGMKMH